MSPGCETGTPAPPSLGYCRELRKSPVWLWLAPWPQHRGHHDSIFSRILSLLCSSLWHWWKKPQRRNLILLVSLHWHVLDIWPSILWKSNWYYLKFALRKGDTWFYQTILHLAKVFNDFFKCAILAHLLKYDSNEEIFNNPTCSGPFSYRKHTCLGQDCSVLCVSALAFTLPLPHLGSMSAPST